MAQKEDFSWHVMLTTTTIWYQKSFQSSSLVNWTFFGTICGILPLLNDTNCHEPDGEEEFFWHVIQCLFLWKTTTGHRSCNRDQCYRMVPKDFPIFLHWTFFAPFVQFYLFLRVKEIFFGTSSNAVKDYYWTHVSLYRYQWYQKSFQSSSLMNNRMLSYLSQDRDIPNGYI